MCASLTVLGGSEFEYTVNKSRFISVTEHIESKEDALSVIQREKSRFPDATHHCWAYILDQSGTGTKFSDDGEPSGTAGMPILNVMQKQGLSHCITVVTRYFGGILLGAGGLVRAYTNSAVGSVSAAGTACIELCESFCVTVSYPVYERLRPALAADKRIIVSGTDYASGVTLRLCVRQSDFDAVCRELTSCCSGNLTMTEPRRESRLWPQQQTDN